MLNPLSSPGKPNHLTPFADESANVPDEQRRSTLLEGELVEQIDKCQYLQSMFSANGQGITGIRGRINLDRFTLSRPQYCL